MKKILNELKQKVVNSVIKKIKQNDLSLYKQKSKYAAVLLCERSLTTCLGLTFQDIAEKCSTKLKVENTDKKIKTLGIDLRIFDGKTIYEGQLKTEANTQTGTYKNDGINKLLQTTNSHNTIPFFATALGKSHDYISDGIRYIGGEAFWNWIGVSYMDLVKNYADLIQECEDEVLNKTNNEFSKNQKIGLFF